MYQSHDSELRKRIGGLGISQSVMSTKPQRALRLRSLKYVVLVAALAFGALLWFGTRYGRPLAQSLPDAAPFYASVNLDHGSRWYGARFWERSAPGTDPVAGLIARTDLISFGSVTFAEVLGLFRGTLEFAELWSGEFVLAGTLADAGAWATLSGVPEPKESEVYPGFGPTGGLWAPKSPEWVWFVRESVLYIASSAGVADELSKKHSQTLAQALMRVQAKGDLGTLYVSGSESAIVRHPFVSLLLQGKSRQEVLDFYYSPGKITFSSPSSNEKSGATDLSSSGTRPLAKLYEGSGADAAVYVSRVGPSYREWVSGLTGRVPEGVGSVQALLGAFYHTDVQRLLDALGDSELLFILKEPEPGAASELSWLAAVSQDAPLELITPVAETLFSVTHPVAQEVPLADGTSMVELRADITGLLWQQISVPYEGQEAPFAELRGVGEVRGPATGVIPGVGRVLTNDVSLIASLSAPRRTDLCSHGGPIAGGVRISGSLISRMYPALGDLAGITITDSGESGIAGCVDFLF
ncbi:MAG: hypothetical protein AAB671_01160 [Patescibacteria group bacterium]